MQRNPFSKHLLYAHPTVYDRVVHLADHYAGIPKVVRSIPARDGQYQLFQIDTIPIRYQGLLVVSIPNFHTDTSKFELPSTVLLRHIIVAKIVLNNCGKFFLEHNWWFYLDPISTNILPGKKFTLFTFSLLWLGFSWVFHAYTLSKKWRRLSIKLAILNGSIDTCPELASIDSIDTWYRYRTHT